MDTTSKYAEILKSILLKYARMKPSHGRIGVFPVFDDQHGTYCLVDAGWNLERRIHSLIFFARLVDGCVRLEWDGIGHGITPELIEAGVPEDRVQLAWTEECPPEAKRPSSRTSGTPHSAVSPG